MVQSSISLDSHIKLFQKGIAEKIDFSYAGAQAGQLAEAIKSGLVKLGDIHTYLELFGRYFMDLIPRVSLTAAYQADREGNLYTGSNTEDTPVIVEATKFRQGIVIVQVNEIVDHLPRVDIPADWVDFVIQSPRPFYLEPLFTRDPALITEAQILRAMMAIKGIYAEYGVQTVNHGIGFDTAAIELLLPCLLYTSLQADHALRYGFVTTETVSFAIVARGFARQIRRALEGGRLNLGRSTLATP